jgi:uncharacterized protein
MSTVRQTLPVFRSPAEHKGLPPGVGIGLKREHVGALLADPSLVDFVEIHAENFMSAGGPNLHMLDRIAEAWPLSIHGVGLSIGSEGRLDKQHLKRLRSLIDRAKPVSFSEHLAWSSHDGVYFNDLLPVAYDTPMLARVIDNITEAQDYLGVRLLLENPSTYVELSQSTWHEAEFLSEIARTSGCGLLLDVNNLFVSSHNHGRSIEDWLARINLSAVGEIHVAGHEKIADEAGDVLLIDNHGAPVSAAVLELLRQVIALGGNRPVLIERDNDVPPLAELLEEAADIRELIAQLDHSAVL